MSKQGAITRVRLLIDGCFVDSASEQWRTAVDPATREIPIRESFVTGSKSSATLRTRRRAPIAAHAPTLLKHQRPTREHLVAPRRCDGDRLGSPLNATTALK